MDFLMSAPQQFFQNGVFSPVFSAPLAFDGQVGGHTIVDVFAAPFSKSGSAVRLTLVGASSGAMTGLSLWIGKQGVGNPYNFDGTQVQVTVGGLTSINIPQNTTVVSDAIPFNFVKANNFLAALQCPTFMGGFFGSATGVTDYFGVGLSEASLTTKSAGYNPGPSACRLVSKIEVFG